MKKKIVLMCLCVSYTWALCAQEKREFVVNDFVIMMSERFKTSDVTIRIYGQPVSTETKAAKDFFANSSEEAVLLFYNYEDARFVFFIDKEKHFLKFWEITGNFADFSPLLSNNMTLRDVKNIFGDNNAIPIDDGIRYQTDIGTIWFSFVDNRLVSISWSRGV